MNTLQVIELLIAIILNFLIGSLSEAANRGLFLNVTLDFLQHICLTHFKTSLSCQYILTRKLNNIFCFSEIMNSQAFIVIRAIKLMSNTTRQKNMTLTITEILNIFSLIIELINAIGLLVVNSGLF